MDSQLKEKSILILEDMKKQVETWDWDEDYYNSGLEMREDRIEYAQAMITDMIDYFKCC